MDNIRDYESMLADYFSGNLSPEKKQEVEQWKDTSENNKLIFNKAKHVWQSMDLLQEMKQYNATQALTDVNSKISFGIKSKANKLIYYWQRIAAVLLLPIIIIAGVYFVQEKKLQENNIVWQSISTPPGIKSQAELPDGTKVWLNSGSVLQFPTSFSSNERTVKLSGEAFFDVVKDKDQPFLVDLGKIGIEVLGTKFNVVNYEKENLIEVVLASGKVQLYNGKTGREEVVSEMIPGEMVLFEKKENQISKMTVDIDKYTAWINGQLIFRDDDMGNVVRRLERWFNVVIEMEDQEISEYIYTAKFHGETIDQILNLLQRTSPIEYVSIPAKQLRDGSFEKQKIILKKRNI